MNEKITYRPGLSRISQHKSVSHLYEVPKNNIMDFGLPMCSRGWNANNGESYSIFRGNVSKKGICKICKKRAEKNLPGISAK